MAELLGFWQNPEIRVTKCVMTVTLGTVIACALDVISPLSLYLDWDYIWEHQEFWRMVTSFLYFGPVGLRLCWSLYIFFFFCSSLENSSSASKSADFAWMLVCLCSIILTFTYLLARDRLWVSTLLVNALSYIWSHRNVRVRLQLFLMFEIPAPYLTWAMGGLQILFGERSMDMLGAILVGHTYYYLHDIYPRMPTSKGFNIFRTPAFVKALIG